MATIKQLKEGDVAPILRFTLTDQDSNAVNLTDCTATLVMSGGNTQTRMSLTCTVDSATQGTCHYDLTAADTDVPGKYQLEVVVASTVTGVRYTTTTLAELEILEAL